MNLIPIIFDSLCIIVVLVFFGRRLTLLHPLTAYLFFHIYCFSVRAWEIYHGAPTMYSVGYSSHYEAISFDEIERALLYADIGLVMFATGCWLSRIRSETLIASGQEFSWKPIVPPITKFILSVSLLIGTTLFFLVRSRSSNLDFGALSQYAGVTTMWPITCFIAFYFINRKFWIIAIPTIAYLSVVSIQGFHRFMLVLPVLCLLGVYIYNTRRSWPNLWQWMLVALIFVIFPSLKGIGRAIGEGDMAMAKQYVASAFSPRPEIDDLEISQGFLDQYAGFLTMCDRYGQYEYGRTYMAILTLPIPRGWWAEKPGLGDHIIKRATPSRPYDREGRIITYLGQSYVNFGLLGVILIPAILAFILVRFYERFTRLPPQSLAAMTYIFVASTFLQAFRDGLTSFVLFGFVFNMPLIFIWVAHLPVPSRPFTSNMQKSRP